jgi:hypothetical protein
MTKATPKSLASGSMSMCLAQMLSYDQSMDRYIVLSFEHQNAGLSVWSLESGFPAHPNWPVVALRQRLSCRSPRSSRT